MSILNFLQYCLCSMLWFFGLEEFGLLSSLTRDQTCTPALKVKSSPLHHQGHPQHFDLAQLLTLFTNIGGR